MKRAMFFVVLPPIYISWDAQKVSHSVDLTNVAINACTGMVSCYPTTT